MDTQHRARRNRTTPEGGPQMASQVGQVNAICQAQGLVEENSLKGRKSQKRY